MDFRIELTIQFSMQAAFYLNASTCFDLNVSCEGGVILVAGEKPNYFILMVIKC